MVQVIQPRDIGGEMGQAIGGGFGDAMKLLGQGAVTGGALDELTNLDTTKLTDQQIMGHVFKAVRFSPHLQKQAGDMAKLLIDRKKAAGLAEVYENIAKQYKGKQGQDGQPLAEGAEILAETGGLPQEGGPSVGAPDQTISQGAQGGFPQTPDMRTVPQIQDQPGTGPLLSPETIQGIAQPLIAAGAYAEIPKAIQKAEQTALKQRELQLQEVEALRKEQTLKRELEGELAQNVLSKTKDLLQKKGMTTQGSPIMDQAGNVVGTNQVVDEQWNRLAYKYFQDERGEPKNANKSDEQLWQNAGRRLESKINSIAAAGAEHYRPTWDFNKDRRAKSAQKWAQDHLKAYGNSKEDRELLKSVMMDNAWTREEASAIVQPTSPELEAVYKKIKGIPPAQLPGHPAQMRQVQASRPIRFDEFREKMVPELKKSFGPNESLVLLKSRLVRNKGLNDDEAIIVINEMQEGKDGIRLQEHQITEENYLGRNVRPSPYDIFFSDRRAMEMMRPLIQ